MDLFKLDEASLNLGFRVLFVVVVHFKFNPMKSLNKPFLFCQLVQLPLTKRSTVWSLTANIITNIITKQQKRKGGQSLEVLMKDRCENLK